MACKAVRRYNVRVNVLVFAIATVAALLTATEAPFERPRVGFIWHFPFVDVGTQHMAASGATSNIARVPWAVVQPEPNRWDFTCLKRQIAEAEKGGFGLVLLLECNPFCSPGWLREQVRAAGESACGPDGAMSDIPSTTSRLFEAAQREMIRRTLAEVRRLDTQRVVSHFQFGVEWWFPPEHRYAAADLERFREWLKRRYRSVKALNDAWQTSFASFAAVEPPRLAIGSRLWEKGREGLVSVEPVGDDPMGRVAAYDWATFWHASAAAYVDRLASIGRRLGAHRPAMSFLTFSFAQGIEWDYVDWSAIRLDAFCRAARDILEVGMQLPVARGDLFRIAVGLDIARKYRKPMNVIDLLDFTDGVKAGRAVHERATEVAVQHGASALYYCCWNGAKDFNFYPDWPLEEINRMVDGAVRQLERVKGAQVVPDGAIILPIVPATPGTEAKRSRAAAAFMGWYKLLWAMGLTVDVLTLDEIEQGRSLRYEWLLVPACDIMPRKAASRLASILPPARVIVAGSGPTEDERGIPMPNALPRATRIADFGGEYAGTMTRDAAAGDTPPLVMWRPETAEHRATLHRARHATRDLLKHAGGNARLIGPADTVTCVTRRGHGTLIAHLVNLGDRPIIGSRLLVPGASGQRVAIVADGRSDGGDTRADSMGIVELPTFRVSCVLSLPEPRRQTAQSSTN